MTAPERGLIDTAAEGYTLGAMMLNESVIDEVSPLIEARDFYHPKNETIYNAILAAYVAGVKPEPIAVSDVLSRNGDLVKVGGFGYLHELVQNVPTPRNGAYYAGLVREAALLRRLEAVGTRIAQLATSGRDDVEAALSQAASLLDGVSGQVASKRDVSNFGRDLDVILERISTKDDGATGLTWGWPDVDAVLGPASPGQMIVVSGRPGMGKSTFVRNAALHIACTLRKRVLIHTLEVSRQETEDALLAAASGVPLDRITDHDLLDADWDKVAKARKDIDDSDLFVDGTPEMSLPGLRASIRRFKPDFVVVDQLQHMIPPPAGSREEAVSANSRGVKTAAMAEGIPIAVVSKMGRGPEQRTDKRPTMADLRESGSIESDADVVILLFREEVYVKETPRAGEVDVIIDKQRRGGPNEATLASQLHYARFVNLFRER